MAKYIFHMKPMLIKSYLDPNKQYILGTQRADLVYTEEVYKEVCDEWEAIQNAKLLEPEVEEEVIEVASNSDPNKKYQVTKHKDGKFSCTCPGFGFRRFCSHIEKLGAKKNA